MTARLISLLIARTVIFGAPPGLLAGVVPEPPLLLPPTPWPGGLPTFTLVGVGVGDPGWFAGEGLAAATA